jgi:hypothetical protein
MTLCYRLLHYYILCSILQSMTQSHQFIFGNKQFFIDQTLDSKEIVVPFQAGTRNCCLLQSIQTGSGIPLVFNSVGSDWGLKQNKTSTSAKVKDAWSYTSSSPFTSSFLKFFLHTPFNYF